MGASLAELAILALLVWWMARLLKPLRVRIERALLRRLAPGRAEVIDAEIVPSPARKKE